MDCIFEPEAGLGGLYIGSKQAANDPEELRRRGIKAVLCVAANNQITYGPDQAIAQKIIPAQENESFELLPYFEEGIEFIEENRKTTNVLIYGFAGVSRSGAILIAYLMKSLGMGMQEACALAKRKRSVILPNHGFKAQLERFEKELLKSRGLRAELTTLDCQLYR